MKKPLLIISMLTAILFAALKLLHIAAIADFLDTAYWFITVAAMVFAAARALIKAARLRDRDAMFTGALGLGILAVSAVYYVAYSFLVGAESGLNISDFSDACSYLFFLAAVSILLLPPIKIERLIRVGIGVVSAAILGITITAIMTNNGNLLYVTVLVTAAICSSLSVYLLVQSRRVRQLKPAGLFACAMIFMGLVDTAVYLGFLTGAGDDWYQTFAVFYIPVLIWCSEGLRNLREGDASHG